MSDVSAGSSLSLVITSLVSAFLGYLLIKMLLPKNDGIKSVPGGLPFFGHVATMIKGSPWDTMANWVIQHGTFFKFHLFGSDAICVANPALLKCILQTKLSSFQKDTVWTYKPFMVLLGKGIVTAEGEDWRSQRTLLATHLKVDILDEVPQMALSAVRRLCVKLDKSKATGVAIDMAEEFRHMALQVISEALLSLSPEESDSTFAHMYLPIVEEGNLRTWHPEREFLPTPSWFKFRADVAKLNNYVESLITKRRQLRAEEAQEEVKSKVPTSRNQDVLDKILSSFEKDNSWDAESMVRVRDGIKTFVLAGHETSASMLTWALYEISLPQNKSVCEQVITEAENTFSNLFTHTGDVLTSVPNRTIINDGLEYTECCLKESLRKYSVVPTVVRVAVTDVDISDEEHKSYRIKKGSTLMINIQGVHHNPAYWPEPQEYKPERFMSVLDRETGKKVPADVKDFTFLPFIAGPRNCLGQFLSLLESKIVLSVLLKRYQFEVVDVKESGTKHAFMVPIIPKSGLFVKVH